ncbi:hypothetical protein SeLEV6574_g07369 [Synchytrium endobioticum]|uniref:LysM domain-containing protein n=1 Tax=Synchytrium endobioticum TaxID=286115 RepID=A0A507CDU4_9FUNG|nr:hypothetical protein SeLEV6574_g07369 [Synchytrium endobioticum]
MAKLITSITLTLIVAFAAAENQNATLVANCAKTVTVQAGDNLASIAENNGLVNAGDLVLLNPGLTNISPGQVICVEGSDPVSAAAPVGGQPQGMPTAKLTPHAIHTGAPIAPGVNPQGQCIKTRTVISGDTCLSLAASNNFQGAEPTTKFQLINKVLINRYVDCAALPIGEKKRTTTIKASDTLINVAMSAGLASLSQLVAMNPGLQPDASIYAGNNLCVQV